MNIPRLEDLSPQKRELLLQKLRARKRGGAPDAAPKPRAALLLGDFPLAYAQERLWFLDQLEPGNPFYNMPGAVRLSGALDERSLARALSELARRHAVLRTTFPSVAGRPIQRLGPPRAASLPVVDLSRLSLASARALARALAAKLARRPFDLARGPVFRSLLLRLGPAERVLAFALHHIVSDAWSMRIVAREVGVLYQAFARGLASPLPEPPVQYAELAARERAGLAASDGRLAAQLAYWRERLEPSPEPLDLPADRARPEAPTYRGAIEPLGIEPAVAARLRELARSEKATTFMLLAAGLFSLLHRLTGRVDLTLGTPIANRDRVEAEGLLGFFVNTLVLRADLGGDPPFRELLGRVRQSAFGAFGHAELPFERLVEELAPERDLARPPFFQVLFAYQSVPGSVAERTGEEAAAPAVQALDVDAGRALFDLTLTLDDGADRLEGGLEFATDLFDRTRMRRTADHLVRLLAAVASDPDRRLSELPLLSRPEIHQLAVEWNETEALPEAACLHDLFAEQAAIAPDAAAVLWGTESWSYRELQRRAARLARRLRGEARPRPEAPIGVCLRRTPHLIAGLLAILETGAAYLPLDPAYPTERLRLMLEDSGADVLLTEEPLFTERFSLSERATLPTDLRVLAIDSEPLGSGNGFARTDPPAPRVPSLPESLAYLIYTSGSTGRPKAVAIEHRQASALLAWAGRAFSRAELAGVLASTSICFDLSVFEIFAPLVHGGAIVLADDALALPGLAAVTLVNTVPSAMAELVRASPCPPALRTVCLAGEPLSRQLVEAIHERWGIERIWNLYGPSEDTTYSTGIPVPVGVPAAPTIGRPIDGGRAFLVDRQGALLPIGIPGELVLGGAGLARGYLGRPELTAERWRGVPASLAATGSVRAGDRLYRTGDLARFRADGEIEFLGRIDDQVKVRGFRIELGEVEEVLRAHPVVREAAVLARREEGRLIAYLAVEERAQSADRFAPLDDLPRELSAWLGARLPAYMIPAVIVPLSELPHTPNGKIDRRALAGRALPGIERRSGPPASATPAEELIAAVWERVLGIQGIGGHDNFFDLGGHSLLATQVASRLSEAFGFDLPLRALFEAPTVAGLADRIARLEATGRSAAPTPPLVRLPRDDSFRPPLTFGQLRLWFLDQLEQSAAGRSAYNLPAAVRLRGKLSPAALAAALAEVARRHEGLRTTFALRGEEPEQVIAPPGSVPLPFADLAGLESAVREGEARRIATREARRPFDLSRGPILRARLLRLDADEHALVLTVHHIASDGWSMDLLLAELSALSTAFAAARPSPLPEPAIQIADYAVWQRSWLAGETLAGEVSWWRETLAGIPALLDLPADRPHPPVQTFRGAHRGRVLDRTLSEGVRRLGREQAATPFMATLAAWATVLHRGSGQPTVVIGTPIANRHHREVEGLIGFLANTLALRTDLDGDPTFAALLARVREAALGAYAHQDLPFERLVEELAPARELGQSPIFQTMFSFQTRTRPAAGAAGAEPGLTVTALEADPGTAKFDLTLALVADGPALAASLEWNVDLFDPATALRLLDRFERLLAAAVAEPGTRISELGLLAASERHQLLVEWNDEGDLAPDLRVHELVERQAERVPDRVAVCRDGEHLTYGALLDRADRLARRLRRDFQVREDSIVGICTSRTPAMLVALLGILEAGAAYLPLDPAYPIERLAFLLDDARVSVLVTESAILAETFSRLDEGALSAQVGLVCLDREGWDAEPDPASSAAPARSDARASGGLPGSLAYVIYTSGSTGRPKGVALEHRMLANLLLSVARTPGLAASDVLLAVTALSFDIASAEMFLPLVVGARIEIASREEAADGERLFTRLRETAATVIQATPSTWRLLVEAGWLGDPRLDARVTGEAFPQALAADLASRTAPVWNLYGPTETTIWSSLARVGARGVTIGRPVANTSLAIVEASGALAALGTTGELLIGGRGIARGYLGRPDLTAERFVPDPFSGLPGARLYRTGDLVRFRPDGEILYLGRRDFQVKIRGFRIELQEIEGVLAGHPDVAEAVVASRSGALVALEGKGTAPGSEEVRLVAYFVAAPGGAPDADGLRAHLRAKLPAHMVPWAFVALPALPRNANGKIDRAALPAPSRGDWSGRTPFEEPRSETERTIAAIWCEVLGLERVGVGDNFFDSGGHSLLAVRVNQRLKASFGREIPLVALFAHPTVGALARHLEKVASSAGATDGRDEPSDLASRERGQDRGAKRRDVAERRKARAARTGLATMEEPEKPDEQEA